MGLAHFYGWSIADVKALTVEEFAAAQNYARKYQEAQKRS